MLYSGNSDFSVDYALMQKMQGRSICRYKFAPVFVCEACKQKEDYVLITATDATKQFKVNRQLLQGLPDVPFRTRWGTIGCMYRKKDVERVSFSVHGGEEGLQKVREKRKERAEKIVATKKRKLEVRRKELVAALQERGLELRSDSNLCEQYINGEIEIPVGEVVNTMEKNHILYEKLNFQSLWDKYLSLHPYDSDDGEPFYKKKEDLKDRVWNAYKKNEDLSKFSLF